VQKRSAASSRSASRRRGNEPKIKGWNELQIIEVITGSVSLASVPQGQTRMMPKGEFRLALSLAFALALGCITAAVFAARLAP
jgi:hypothetical protein